MFTGWFTVRQLYKENIVFSAVDLWPRVPAEVFSKKRKNASLLRSGFKPTGTGEGRLQVSFSLQDFTAPLLCVPLNIY